MERKIPVAITEKWLEWKKWANHWNWMHHSTGFTSAALTVLIAANAKGQFLDPILATVLAAVAAGLAFLVTAQGAQTKAKGFELAARELEVAMAKYRFDDSLPDSFLGQAEATGVATLNSMK